MHAFWQHLPALVWMAALGLAAGNYACSFIHRLPRSLSITADAPYCGSCRTLLRTRDLFPVFSWLMLRGRCRYCNEAIPAIYTVVELSSAALFCLAYLRYGFADVAVIVLLLGMSLIILAAIEALTGKIEARVLLAAFVFAALLRTLADGTIFIFAYAGFVGLLIGVSYRKLIRRDSRLDVVAAMLPALFLLSLGDDKKMLICGILAASALCIMQAIFKIRRTMLPLTTGILSSLLLCNYSTVTDLAKFLG